ncbi:MAG: succinyldiaminopimelate transaminase [Candidatus Ancillula sp.]|jgi:succinyldiaminopimelate transaminase|nr:succinyldiaminopimelate transaminase [Candidatus Ancillula sp.]
MWYNGGMSLANLAAVTFPWDQLLPYRKLAQASAEKLGCSFIDTTVGSPIDDVSKTVQNAVVPSLNAHGYPMTAGFPELRKAIVQWLKTTWNIPELDENNILPTIGSKEVVGMLPMMLNLGPDDIMVRPSIAYPTYDIGAVAARTQILATNNIEDWCNNTSVKLVWINYPNNPTGECTSLEHLKAVVRAARRIGAVVASDECYSLFNWKNGANGAIVPHPSVLETALDGDFSNILMLYSLSKHANLAGYRSAFIAGDKKIIQELLTIRKQLGLIPPHISQIALKAALEDNEFITKILENYQTRHFLLHSILQRAGYDIEHSEGGLYIWMRTKKDEWEVLDEFVKLGILVTPGSFYKHSLLNNIRISTTIRTEDILEIGRRLGVEI